MLLSEAIENKYHEATKHSELSVQIDPNYVDARTQPASFKIYPHFFRRFPLDPTDSFHHFLSLTSAITYQKQYRDGATHLLRVQPSAGALYPTELYVQLRGIKGMLDGIYHLEPQNNVLTLIYELIDDGLEAYLQDDRLIHGCIFLVSCVYFRSSWKYKNRSLRYCFLDSGHHLGAIEASAYVSGYPYRLLFDFDRVALNDILGFENKEFVTALAIVGEAKEKTARRLRSPLPIVPGSDYFEPNQFIEVGYQDTFSENPQLPSLQQPLFAFEPSQWLQAIQQRRSARRFYPHPISRDAFQKVCTAFQQPIPGDRLETLEIYAVVQRVTDLQPGLYRDRFTESRDCLKVGEFQTRTGYLCINQAIARDSAVVFFIVAHCDNYRVALNQAGIVGQRIYLAATALNLGCSGIGAFYDDETQAFLETDGSVLYAIAIGQTIKPVTNHQSPVTSKHKCN
ncbi:MAG: SagB/ThcOx family dehydrogenase [Spirulina sp.]